MSNREDGSHSERSFPLVPSLETAEDHFRVVSCISIYPCFLVFEIIRVFTHLCHYEPFCGGLQLTRALPFSFSFFWLVLFELIFKYRLQGPRGWSNLSRISLRVGRNWVIWIKLFSSTTTFRRPSPFEMITMPDKQLTQFTKKQKDILGDYERHALLPAHISHTVKQLPLILYTSALTVFHYFVTISATGNAL